MRKLKRLAFLFLLSTLLLLAFAVTASAEERGACGDGVTYTYADGTLTVEGNGAMANYDNNYNKAPWAQYRQSIKRVEVGEGVTSIGSFSFAFCTALTEVSLPNTLETVGSDAFVNCSALSEIALPASVRSIGSSAFQGCSALQKVGSLGSVSELKRSTFQGCSRLSVLYLPSTLNSVHDAAFYGVPLSSLTVYYPDSPARFAGIRSYMEGDTTGTPINPNQYKKIYYGVRVKVEYVMAGNRAEAPTPPDAVLGYADGVYTYEIPVPTVAGHTHDVAGGVLTGDFRGHTDYVIPLTVTYTPNKYDLTLDFIDHKGNPLEKDGEPLSYTEEMTYGDLFDFDINTFLRINGFSVYTPELPKYEDELITGKFSATIRCVPPKYTLTVNYLDTLGRTVEKSYTEQVYYTDAFEVPSPTPDFYDLTEGQETVSGVMGTENLEFTVRYTPHTFTLTVLYVDEQGSPMLGVDGNPLQSVIQSVFYKDTYSIPTPGKPQVAFYYSASLSSVEGSMDGLAEQEAATHSRTVTVRYTLNSYDVVVHLQDQNGDTIAEDFHYPVRYGEDFSFAPPTLDGYETETTEISGTMSGEGLARIVYYTKILPPEPPVPAPKTHVFLVVILITLGVLAIAGASFWALKKLR